MSSQIQTVATIAKVRLRVDVRIMGVPPGRPVEGVGEAWPSLAGSCHGAPGPSLQRVTTAC